MRRNAMKTFGVLFRKLRMVLFLVEKRTERREVT